APAGVPGPARRSAWPAKYFARLSTRRIRMSSFPAQVFRVEYPYAAALADPDPTDSMTTLPLDPPLRVALAQGALAELYTLKSDARAAAALQLYEARLELHWRYTERQLRTQFGQASHQARRGPYS